MQIKTFILLTYVFAYVLSTSLYPYQLGNNCSTKYILNGNTLKYDAYSDYEAAYHKIASCASLRSTYNTACCYLRVKFKNNVAGERYTHKGCIEITGNEWQNIKSVINSLEGNITSGVSGLELSKRKVSIDCYSKYIKLAGLFIFALLL